MTKVIQNNVDLVEKCVNAVTSKATNDIFTQVIGLDRLSDITEDLTASIASELRSQSFMTKQLELSDEQKSAIEVKLSAMAQRSKENYISNIKKDKRASLVVEIVENSIKAVIDQILQAIALEINRGVVLNAIAVACDTKNEKYNKCELNYSKSAGDITIPSNTILISTNAIDIIKNSISVTEKNQDSTKAA